MDVVVHTSTIGVNAAFLQEIKEGHQEFGEVLELVKDTCQSKNELEVIAKKLVKLIARLRDCLTFRFALEETYGFLELNEPQEFPNSPQARRARDQHFGLFLEVCSLCEQAEQLRFSGFREPYISKLIAQTERFCCELDDHEQLECELIEAQLGTSPKIT